MKSKIINAPLFPNQDSGREILKHNEYPVFMTDEFDFFRCVQFNSDLYGKSVYILNEGNLRMSNINNRYSSLFPNQKLSYWADSIEMATKEIKKHGSNNNIIVFWAYDDLTSTFPIIDNDERLIIVDGRDTEFHKILEKVELNITLSKNDEKVISDIKKLNPDCLAYKSVANPGGVNFLFFEKGFRKLSIRQVKLKLGERKSKNHNSIVCADFCDYTPFPESYGECFVPLAKIAMDNSYLNTEDYKEKIRVKKESYARFHEDRNK